MFKRQTYPRVCVPFQIKGTDKDFSGIVVLSLGLFEAQ